MLISIDLSIKSAGVAIQYTKNNEKHIVLYSPTEYKVNDEKSSYGELNKDKICIFFIHNDVIEKFKKSNLDLKEHYFDRIKHNVKMFMNVLNKTLETIKESADDKEMKFSIEGFSFNAKGLGMDIAEFAGIIKYFIEETYKTSVLVIPPTTIKKFAYKGNATKEEMVEAAMRNDDIRKAFESMKEYYVKKKSEKNPLYESPFNDLVDAYFQLKYFESIICQ